MSGNKEKLSRRIERYLKNLMKALFGLDPYRDELEEANEQVRKSAENMKAMRDHLYAALEKWDNAVTEMEKSDALATSLQKLTENLRRRIIEKDDEIKAAGEEFRQRMERMKQDYQQRIDKYNQLIDTIRSDKRVPYDIGVLIDNLTNGKQEG